MEITHERKELMNMVHQAVMDRGIEFRKSTSSVEISRTSAGKPSFCVKVYDDDPVKAANYARYLERNLAEEYLGQENTGAVPIEEPDFDDVPEAMLMSPAQVRGEAVADSKEVKAAEDVQLDDDGGFE